MSLPAGLSLMSVEISQTRARRSNNVLAAAAAAAAATSIACLLAQSAIAPAAASRSPLPVAPNDGVLFGAWYDRPHGDTPLDINNRLGRNLSFFQTDIDLTGTSKPETAPNITDQFIQHLDQTNTDAIAYLTVYPFYGFDAVTDAQLDDLVTRIKKIIASGRSLFLRYAPEMNGSWFYYGQNPEGFVTSWKRVYSYVTSRLGSDIDKIAFLWSPNSADGYPWPGGVSSPQYPLNSTDASRVKLLDTDNDGNLTMNDNPYSPYYPGDDFVDWVGFSVYHYGEEWRWCQNVVPAPGKFEAILNGTSGKQPGNYSFYDMFSGSKATSLTKADKPFFVSETGAAYHLGLSPEPPADDTPAILADCARQIDTTVDRVGVKQGWWRQFLDADFLKRHPRLKAIGLFEFVKPEEETQRDFTNLGKAPFADDPTVPVLNAFKADLSGGYDVNLVFAKSGAVSGGGNGGSTASSTSATVMPSATSSKSAATRASAAAFGFVWLAAAAAIVLA
ncbi:glycoside hydrolase superfamily [Zopfochytrium polystomum]|nr:glycoside hydrolase superfamily [Zopfochytrium polystomum]